MTVRGIHWITRGGMTVREDTYEYRGKDTYSTADTFDYIHMITGRHDSTGDRKEYTGNMSVRGDTLEYRGDMGLP